MNYRRLRVPGACYFFTVVTAGRQPVFDDPAAVQALRSAFRTVRERHPFEVIAAVVLPDHLHCIWSLPEADADYATRWLLIKSATTRRLRADNLQGAVWQRRFWEHCIRDVRDLEAHAAYIHYNPVRHGLVQRASEWPWSSYHRWIEHGLYPSGWGDTEPDLPEIVGNE